MYNWARYYDVNGKDRNKLKIIIDEVVDFEKKIAKILENKTIDMRIDSLKSMEIYTGIKWSRYFHIISTLNSKQWKVNSFTLINDNDPIIINNIDAFVNVIAVIQNTSKHILYNFFWLKAFLYFWIEIQPKNSANCLEKFLSPKFPLNFAITRLFIDYSLKPGSKLKAIHMVNQLKQSAIRSMEMNKILNNRTREMNIEKIRNIIDFIAFPEWLINDANMDDFYGLYGSIDLLIVNDFWQSSVQLFRYNKYRMFQLMKQQRDDLNFHE